MDTHTRNSTQGKVRSAVWEHFEKLDSTTAKCRQCSKIYAADAMRNGTSNLIAHIKRCSFFQAMGRQRT